MDMLHIEGDQIVDAQGQPVYLRGTCVGGWMNMEDFIDGYPGAEHELRDAMAQELGQGKARFFLDRLLDYFLAEEDIAYIRSLGANTVRLALNYRHFERDAEPFHYLEDGFARLDRAIRWCAKHGLYAILDLHSVQGWQNPDWHCDNASRHTYFWRHPHFQERFYALWKEIARRYRGNPTVAGYNVMNEPVTNLPYGRFRNEYEPDWAAINRVYRQVVSAIREVDPEHIIFLEGDLFSSRLDGLEPPFATNLVYSSHNYNAAGFGPGRYPGKIGGRHWDIETQWEVFENSSGRRYALKNHTPLWIGEFGATCNGPEEEIPDRLHALDDQLSVYNQAGAHWTTWTYKDVNVMGWVQLDPESLYIQTIKPVLESKRELATDFWMSWLPPTPARRQVTGFARTVEGILMDSSIDPQANQTFLGQQLLSGYVAALMQPLYARCFKGMSEEKLDDVLSSFAFKNCIPHQGLVEIIKKNL